MGRAVRKNKRRSNPARDVLKRLYERALGDPDFHEALGRARRLHGITPARFPTDIAEATWPDYVKGDMGEFLKTVEVILDRWFPQLPGDYYLSVVRPSAYGAAFLLVCWALCYDLKSIPIPILILASAPPLSAEEAKRTFTIPYITTTCDLVAPFLIYFNSAIRDELLDLQWDHKQTSQFLERTWDRYLRGWKNRSHVAVILEDSKESRWLSDLKGLGFDAPVLVIPPLVTSEQYRGWWPGIERARNSAYGKPKLPRQRRTSVFDEEIARMWGEGKSETEILKALSSDEDDSAMYDSLLNNIRAVTRSIPRQGSAHRRGGRKSKTR